MNQAVTTRVGRSGAPVAASVGECAGEQKPDFDNRAPRFGEERARMRSVTSLWHEPEVSSELRRCVDRSGQGLLPESLGQEAAAALLMRGTIQARAKVEDLLFSLPKTPEHTTAAMQRIAAQGLLARELAKQIAQSPYVTTAIEWGWRLVRSSSVNPELSRLFVAELGVQVQRQGFGGNKTSVAEAMLRAAMSEDGSIAVQCEAAKALSVFLPHARAAQMLRKRFYGKDTDSRLSRLIGVLLLRSESAGLS